MNVPFSVVRKPINKTEQYIPWEHEQFACKHKFWLPKQLTFIDKSIHGATFSGRSSASANPLDKGCLYDTE